MQVREVIRSLIIFVYFISNLERRDIIIKDLTYFPVVLQTSFVVNSSFNKSQQGSFVVEKCVL